MTQLSCDYVRDSYPDVLNDRVDALRAQQVRAHIASCDACRAEVSVVDMLHELRIPVPAGTHDRVIREVNAPPRRTHTARASLAVAASVALALIGGSVLLQTRTEAVPAAEETFGFVTVENAMLSGKASLDDWSEEDLELLLREMES